MAKLLTVKAKVTYWRRKYFPERQLFLRSEGRVRFLTIGTNTQIFLATVSCSFIVWAAVTSVAYLSHDLRLAAKNQTISSMSLQYKSLSSDFSALEQEVERRALQLEERQALLEKIIELDASKVSGASLKLDEKTNDSKTDSHSSLLDYLTGSNPVQAAELSGMERRQQLLQRLQNAEYRQQLAAHYLTSHIDDRLKHIDDTLAPTNLSYAELEKQWAGDPLAMGGPYKPEQGFEAIFEEGDDKAFSDLSDHWARLEAVTLALESFPAGRPAEKYYLSSRFGKRRDPLKNTWAHHPGLDLAGWPGTKIYATAPGEVIHAAWYGPYGNMVEIDHGNGFRTRYGHMRSLAVQKGDIIPIGTKVGEMGKTGRVTGTHLHYEIWFNGQVQDPLPFLKAAKDVLEIQGKHEENS